MYCFPIYTATGANLGAKNKLRVAYNGILMRLVGIPRWTRDSVVFVECDVDCLDLR